MGTRLATSMPYRHVYDWAIMVPISRYGNTEGASGGHQRIKWYLQSPYVLRNIDHEDRERHYTS